MSYTFDIIGVAPILTFFNYQQEFEREQERGKAYLGSPECSLDAFIRSTETIPQKPDWNWDDVVKSMVNFWLNHADTIQYWKAELAGLGSDNLVVARVANIQVIKRELDSLFKE